MHAIGVDIGGTKIAAGVVDDDGAILAKLRRDTDPDAPGEIERAVIDLVLELRRDFEIGAVGVAAAGFVSSDRATVLFAPNIAWRDYPLRERVEPSVDLPVVVENDANAAGWAEFRFGAGRGVQDMVMLTIGTGLGGAIVVDGKLLRGAHGVAAEIGHVRVVPDGHMCGCGHEGCWEQYASGRALTRQARAAAIANPDRAAALLALSGGEAKKIKGPYVTQVAQAGDALGIELLAELGTWIGSGAASLVAVLDPAVIVVGGGVASAGDLLLEPIRNAFGNSLSARGHRPEPSIVVAEMQNDAGIVGAADLARG
ncbi:MAG TPA: ROK family glucokinase [Actinotalea sp.]|nr:ROK family glucokinase [Actinotalea sp.]